MNNIIFEKVWQDSELIELKITAISELGAIDKLEEKIKKLIDDNIGSKVSLHDNEL